MCGIAGIHAPGATASEDLLRAMVARLVHRGPDGEGYHEEPSLALGMRRLAIVDVAGGAQPLYNESGDVAVVFNGEIYNHRELRGWLEERGHELSSQTDGAVLPPPFEEQGLGLDWKNTRLNSSHAN